MKLLSIKLSNVKSYAADSPRIDFADGLHFLSGRNGAGKSTLLEALGYALFGAEPYRPIAQFIRLGERNASIEVSFVDDEGHPHRVERKFGAKTSWVVYDESDGLALYEKESDVRRFLARLFHIEDPNQLSSVFQNILGVPQGQFTAAFKMTDRQRKDIFDPIIAVDLYRRAADGPLNTLKLERLPHEIAERTHLIDLADAYLREHASAPAKLDAIRTHLSQVVQCLTDVTTRLNERRTRLAFRIRQKERLDHLAHDIHTLEARHTANQARRTDLRDQCIEAESAAQVCDRTRPGHLTYLDAEKKLALLEERRRSRDLLREQAQENRHHLAALESEIAIRRQHLADLEELVRTQLLPREKELAAAIHPVDYAAARAALDHSRDALVRLQSELTILERHRRELAGAQCPFLAEPCDRVAPQAFDTRLRSLQAALETARSAHAERERTEKEAAAELQRVTALQTEFQAIQHRIEEAAQKLRIDRATLDACAEKQTRFARESEHLTGELLSFATVDSDLSATRTAMERTSAEHAAYRTHEHVASQFTSRRDAYAALEHTLADEAQALSSLQGELKALAALYDPNDHQTIAAEIEPLVVEQTSLASQRDTAQTQCTELERVVAECRTHAQERERLTQERMRLERFARLVRDAWSILREVGPSISTRLLAGISARASHLFQVMQREPARLSWGDGYDLTVHLRDGTRAFRTLSGGEQMCAALAIQMAMARDFAQASFCLFDEPTVHLDADRRERLAAAIHDAAREAGFRQVFIASQDDAFEPHVDHVIAIARDERGSHLGVREV